MRGSVSWDQAHELNYTEKEIINKLIKDNVETVKRQNCHYYKY